MANRNRAARVESAAADPPRLASALGPHWSASGRISEAASHSLTPR